MKEKSELDRQIKRAKERYYRSLLHGSKGQIEIARDLWEVLEMKRVNLVKSTNGEKDECKTD